jgi:hypothetical protein
VSEAMSDNTIIQLILAQRARERVEQEKLVRDQNVSGRLLDALADFAAAVFTLFVIAAGAGLYVAASLYNFARR